jgi:hypothetical protein
MSKQEKFSSSKQKLLSMPILESTLVFDKLTRLSTSGYEYNETFFNFEDLLQQSKILEDNPIKYNIQSTSSKITIKLLNPEISQEINLEFDQTKNVYHTPMKKSESLIIMLGGPTKTLQASLFYFSDEFVVLNFSTFLHSSYIYRNDVYFGHIKKEKIITKEHLFDLTFK